MFKLKSLFKYYYIVILISFAVGLMVGLFSISFNSKITENTDIINGISPFREKENTYYFINPLLFYNSPNAIDSKEYSALSSQIKKTIDDFVKDSTTKKVSFYYKDINKVQWVGINENENYTPSSLLKVVIMIAYLKEAEITPAILSRKIIFSKEIRDLIGSIFYDLGTSLELGRTYLVSDLINKMIIDSDNGAAYTLLSAINSNSLNKIYVDLDIKNPGNAGRDYTISTQDYVRFLRILYNATYLDRVMSERALSLLSQTNFQDGIAASTPRSLKVAHKYGETVSSKDDKNIDFIELHDCGIIYYPGKPYLLCIMTRGDNLDALSEIIKNISTIVYKYVDSGN